METIESMLNKTSNWDKEKLSRIFKKIKKEVSLCYHLPFLLFFFTMNSTFTVENAQGVGVHSHVKL